jgi:hypothetical protein
MPHGDKLTRKQEQAVAALLTEKTVEEAARKAGVGYASLKGWLKRPDFQVAFRQARRQVVDGAVGRIQAATGQAVDTLLGVARSGAKDADRVRAAVAILDHAWRGLAEADALHGSEGKDGDGSPMTTADVVQALAGRLRQIDQSELPTGEKARLTAALADALLRAITLDRIAQQLEALQAVLLGRKETDQQ